MADNLTINAAQPLPEFEEKRTRETTGPSNETTSETVTQVPERAAGVAGLDAAAEGERGAAGERVEQANLAAPVQREGLAEQARLADAQAREKEAAIQQSNELIAQARDRTQRRMAELNAMDSPSLYGNTDRHGQIVRGVAMALGGIGDAIQKAAMIRIGKAPPTVDTVGEIIDGILNQQREHISKLKDSVIMARTGEADAREARQQMLSDVDLRGAAMLGRVKALMESRLAAMGKTPDQIAADENVAAVDGKIAERKMKAVEPLLDKVSEIHKSAVTKSGGETINRVPGKAQGAAPTGATAAQSAALAKYVDEHPNASQGDLVEYAAKKLGIPDAQGEVTRVAGTNSLPEKERERQTVDLEGKPVLAPSARNVGSVADQVASTKRATEALDGLIATIKSGSGVGNTAKALLPGSELNAKINEATGLISGAMGLTPSDAKLKMDHAMSGTGGIGLLSGGAEDALGRIRDEVQAFGERKIKGMTTPVREPKSTQPPPEAAREEAAATAKPAPRAEAPKKDDQIAEAKKWLVSPEARKDPAKRKRVYDKLKSMGVTF